MVKENLQRIAASVPSPARLIAVSKTKPVGMIQEAYDAGQRLFGENYATELRDKHALLPPDIEWHFIGHLQPKQLKYYIDFVSMIHGVDSIEHLEAVEKAAAKVGRRVDVLLQFHVAKEETKFGFTLDELTHLERMPDLEHVRICGVMGMATNTDDKALVRSEFAMLHGIFEDLKGRFFAGCDYFREISMGMSHDYTLALEEGATLVRIGSLIFGPRIYNNLSREM